MIQKDLTGQTFGRLTVLCYDHSDKNYNSYWKCACNCGNVKTVQYSGLVTGAISSCGCLKSEIITRHGMTKTSIHTTWRHTLGRCYNKNAVNYSRYGGRGIKVCERWLVFENFYEDVSKLPHFGEKGYSLDRIDNDGDYCPENVKWSTPKEQARNRRNNILVEYEGKQITVAEAAEKTGIKHNILYARYRRGDRGERLFRSVEKI